MRDAARRMRASAGDGVRADVAGAVVGDGPLDSLLRHDEGQPRTGAAAPCRSRGRAGRSPPRRCRTATSGLMNLTFSLVILNSLRLMTMCTRRRESVVGGRRSFAPAGWRGAAGCGAGSLFRPAARVNRHFRYKSDTAARAAPSCAAESSGVSAVIPCGYCGYGGSPIRRTRSWKRGSERRLSKCGSTMRYCI